MSWIFDFIGFSNLWVYFWMANKKLIRNLILIYFMCSGGIHCHMLLLFFKLLHFLQDVGFFLFFFSILISCRCEKHPTIALIILQFSILISCRCEKMWAFFKLWQHFKKLTRNQKDFYIILYYIDIVGTQITAKTQKD